MPALVFLRRTVGGRGVCVVQTCTDAQSAHKAAHIGTTRLTAGACQLSAAAACSTRSMSRCMMAAVSEISLHCLSFQRFCRIC